MLLLVEYQRFGRLQYEHWHLIVLAGLALTGFIVAYHVPRVSVLGRFRDQRRAYWPRPVRRVEFQG
jgi:hypothetical protein